MNTYKHWRLETDSTQILWVCFDKANAAVNTIDPEVMQEFSSIVDDLAHDVLHKGVIIASAKKKGFIAGADISLFTKFKDIPEATRMLMQGQEILSKLEALKLPVVAMIEGFCLGGGLELALACHYRVAEEGAKTRLGLPEVKLGIHPGWGGTVRLPRLIGSPQALNLILNGHTVSGKAAAKLGFVDAAVPKRQLVHAAKYYILKQPPRHKPTFLEGLSNQKLSRQVIGAYIRRQVQAKVNPSHYPAPFHVLDNWEHFGVDTDAAYEREAKSCGKLFFSETCHNLVRVFFLQERLKGLAKDNSFTLQHVHVIGAGTMGGDIAAYCALQGLTVTLQDLEPKYIAPAIKRAYALFKEKLKETYLVQRAMDNLIPDIAGDGIAKADVIIEAVIEDLTVKQNTFKMLEAKAKHQAILATNTSSIPLDDINPVLREPDRLVGIHFFNPVAKMQLVEVVRGERTSPKVADKAIQFVRKIEHLPLPVKSSPGFLVNRILMPYMLGAMNLMKEGVPMTAIDKAMKNFGMPMGPVSLADVVGLDVCLSVAKYLGKYYGLEVPQKLADLVAQHKLGKKTGEGFYKYDKRGKQIRPVEVPYDKPLDDISRHLVLIMLNEAFACLREGVVADGDLLDAGMVYGAGFAPFRGGPIHYAKSQGISELYHEFVRQTGAKGVKEWEAVV
jgi:3-hydroxyacyl-CoA dehydrogenase/enoyl-CoA hydratase/3-hydroxybutyryl-CoA epimerase